MLITEADILNLGAKPLILDLEGLTPAQITRRIVHGMVRGSNMIARIGRIGPAHWAELPTLKPIEEFITDNSIANITVRENKNLNYILLGRQDDQIITTVIVKLYSLQQERALKLKRVLHEN